MNWPGPSPSSLAPKHHGIWAVNVIPHGNEVAFGVEDLDPVGFTVYHVHLIVAVDSDVVRSDELTGVYARFTPGEFVLTLGGVDVDTGVAVTV